MIAIAVASVILLLAAITKACFVGLLTRDGPPPGETPVPASHEFTHGRVFGEEILPDFQKKEYGLTQQAGNLLHEFYHSHIPGKKLTFVGFVSTSLTEEIDGLRVRILYPAGVTIDPSSLVMLDEPRRAVRLSTKVTEPSSVGPYGDSANSASIAIPRLIPVGTRVVVLLAIKSPAGKKTDIANFQFRPETIQ